MTTDWKINVTKQKEKFTQITDLLIEVILHFSVYRL
jgi:hypothetical protein